MSQQQKQPERCMSLDCPEFREPHIKGQFSRCNAGMTTTHTPTPEIRDAAREIHSAPSFLPSGIKRVAELEQQLGDERAAETQATARFAELESAERSKLAERIATLERHLSEFLKLYGVRSGECNTCDHAKTGQAQFHAVWCPVPEAEAALRKETRR